MCPSRRPPRGGDGGVGEGLLDEEGELLGDPDTTDRPPVRIATAGGTDAVLSVTGRV